MSLRDQMLIEKYTIIEKENMIRIILGLHYLLYGKDFEMPEKKTS
jgi:hypothetical protein